MLYLKGSRGFVILVVHLSIQNWRSLLSKMARSLLCTSIYYLLYIYYTKELGVREARDKDALPLATGLPKRHLLLRSLRLSEALRDASSVNMAWGASGCFRHSVCPRETLFMLSNHRRICLTPHSLSDWECKLISTHRSIHGHTNHNETFASGFVRQRGGAQRDALSSALRKQVSLSLYIHLFLYH